ncbi:MAG: alpha/beta fold hydrolase [Proteobacteria bacterium]|nr:alpha/beta fold hydrolase [Pseudomonadota bacterium]
MKINGRTALRIAVVVVAIGVLGWNWLRPHRAQDSASSEDAATPVSAASAPGSPGAPVLQTGAPSGAHPVETFKLGTLTLKACELKQPDSAMTTAAYCVPFPVPENRADPHSRGIDLKLALIKSDAQVAERDIVVYLAGGPGESATQTYPQIAAALAPLRKHHDILLLDQRGTGDSHPLSCPKIQKIADQTADMAFDPKRIRDLTAQCLAEVRKNADPRFYTTTDAVADLEAVRHALGDPKFDLIGISYGTRMAQQYARAHPDGVRSIVLDSAVPNQLILGEEFADNLDHALKLQADACTATPSCDKAFGDWNAALHALHDRLRARPVPTGFADPKTGLPEDKPLTAERLAAVARMYSYSAEAAALLPLTVTQAAKGNTAPLMGQSQLMLSGLDQATNTGMQWSVICSEDADRLQARPQDAGTILGSELIDGIAAACSVWPHGAMPKDFHAPYQSSIPTLILAGERDPVTPPRYAQEILKGLSDARVLEVKGMGHSVLGRGCMPNLVDRFVADLAPKQLDAKCLARVGPIPAFIDFNGASP